MTPASTRAQYRYAINKVGETVLFRRYTGTGPTRTETDYPVRARVMGYQVQSDELIGGTVQEDRRVIALAEDVEASGFPLPLQQTADKIVVRDRVLTIKAINDSTRRYGLLDAFDLRVGG